MKKNIQIIMLAVFIALVVMGWSSSVEAACDNATFKCHDKDWKLLGEISVTCSEKVPYGGGPLPRCLPDLPFSAFSVIDRCRETYPASKRACPNQTTWPSGYSYSKCISYPTY